MLKCIESISRARPPLKREPNFTFSPALNVNIRETIAEVLMRVKWEAWGHRGPRDRPNFMRRIAPIGRRDRAATDLFVEPGAREHDPKNTSTRRGATMKVA